MTIPFPVEELFRMAEAERIEIEWYPNETVGRAPRGRYQVIGEARVIVLSPELSRDAMRLRCTLAHELGHHFCGTWGFGPRDEASATRWAEELLLPWRWLKDKLSWPAGEIAEEAGVYQWMVEERLSRVARRLHAVS